MSTPLQHDDETSSLNFKETELRLGLPGSQSPHRKQVGEVSHNFNKNINVSSSLNNLVCSVGAKRGFFNAIDESSPKNIKDVLHQPLHEKNKHVSGTNEHANALVSKYVFLFFASFCLMKILSFLCVVHYMKLLEQDTGCRMATNSIFSKELDGVEFDKEQ